MNQRRSISERIYARLARLYPRGFREKFREELKYVFADQYSEARQRGLMAVASLWLGTLGDGVTSLIREHVAELKGNMPNGILYYFHQRFTFGRMFAVVSVGLVVLCAAITMMLPKTYMSSAKVLYRQQGATFDPYKMQTSFERIKSRPVLNGVIEDLELRKVFAGEAGVKGEFPTEDAYQMLLSSIQLRQSRNTPVVEISVFSNRPELGANIANKIAGAASRAEGASLIETAAPAVRAVRPNVPLNLVVGTIVSVVVGLIAAAFGRLALWIVFRRA